MAAAGRTAFGGTVRGTVNTKGEALGREVELGEPPRRRSAEVDELCGVVEALGGQVRKLESDNAEMAAKVAELHRLYTASIAELEGRVGIHEQFHVKGESEASDIEKELAAQKRINEQLFNRIQGFRRESYRKEMKLAARCARLEVTLVRERGLARESAGQPE